MLLMILLSFFFTSCNMQTPQTGQKVGRIVKIAEEGLFFKTCEGELIRGGLVDGSGSLGGSFHFTIEDEYLKKLAMQAFEEQSEIIMRYRVDLVTSITRSECRNSYFVTNIEIIR